MRQSTRRWLQEPLSLLAVSYPGKLRLTSLVYGGSIEGDRKIGIRDLCDGVNLGLRYR